MCKNILDDNEIYKSKNETLTNSESVIKKDFKASIMSWQYRKKRDKLIERFQSRL
ncbi:MAG: hypothetical protein ACFE9X_13950 [Promethearchaeota archaeon]